MSDQIIQFILVIIEQLFTINKSDINPEISSILHDKLHPIVGPAGVTSFDSSGLITHGFSDNIIESITLNCDKIFNIHDLVEYGFISSIHLALVVLEVFNEIFEDVEIDTSLYNIATLTVPVYNTILNATATLHQIGQCTNDHTSSDSDE